MGTPPDIPIAIARPASFPTRVFGSAEQLANSTKTLIYIPGDAETLATHVERLAFDEAIRRTWPRSRRGSWTA
jgi:hypothetical protein